MHPRLFILLLFTCGIVAGYSQNNKLVFDVIAGPTAAGRYMDATSYARQFWNKNEKPVLSFDAGALVQVVQRSSWHLQMGIVYSRKGFSYGEVTYRNEKNEVIGRAVFRQRADFLELPLRFIYGFPATTKHFAIVGVSQDILIHNKVVGIADFGLDKELYPDIPELRTYNVGLQLGYAYTFFDNDHFALGFEPNIKGQLFRMLKMDTPARRYFLSAGITLIGRLKA
jgi:hypothetical protein